ncbi:hypothetical protein IFO70_36180 [Phormidium tenue FACHB-886]|nr:hypothetical protein [Phormidium tenue FACHB-886]
MTHLKTDTEHTSILLRVNLTDPQIRLALYALDSALEPTGVFLDVDTHDLLADITRLESLAPIERYRFALSLLNSVS